VGGYRFRGEGVWEVVLVGEDRVEDALGLKDVVLAFETAVE